MLRQKPVHTRRYLVYATVHFSKHFSKHLVLCFTEASDFGDQPGRAAAVC